MTLVLSGCAHCGQPIARGRDDDPWRALPQPERPLLYPAEAITCEARPGDLPHQSPAEVS